MIQPTPSPAPSHRKGDTRSRLLATPVILGVIGGVLALQEFTGSTLGTHLVLAAFGAVAGAEMALLFRAAGRPGRPLQAAVICGALAAVGLVDAWHGHGAWRLGGTMGARVVVLLLALLWGLLAHLKDVRPEAADDLAANWVPVLYVGLPFSFMAEFVPEWRFLLWVVLTAKVSDMAGWAIGKPFGRHKMIPSVSPGKSWEGAAAGLLASALAAVFLPLLLFGTAWEDLAVARLAAFGLLLGAASILAGVTWSGWKRRLGAKDSSALIPHMGGVMDMVDSLLLAAPAAWAWLHWRPW